MKIGSCWQISLLFLNLLFMWSVHRNDIWSTHATVTSYTGKQSKQTNKQHQYLLHGICNDTVTSKIITGKRLQWFTLAALFVWWFRTSFLYSCMHVVCVCVKFSFIYNCYYCSLLLQFCNSGDSVLPVSICCCESVVITCFVSLCFFPACLETGSLAWVNFASVHLSVLLLPAWATVWQMCTVQVMSTLPCEIVLLNVNSWNFKWHLYRWSFKSHSLCILNQELWSQTGPVLQAHSL